MTALQNGKPISEDLSKFLRSFTGPKDMADVSTDTDVSISTIRDVKHRRNNISEENKKAIVRLIMRNFREKNSSSKAWNIKGLNKWN